MKILSFVTLLLSSLFNYAQDNDTTRMMDFVSADGHFNLYYPSSFIVSESDSTGSYIVSFLDSKTDLEITVSTYAQEKKVKESNLKDILAGFLKGKDVSWSSYKSGIADNLIEGRYIENGIHWIWYGISLGNKIVILSINKKEIVSESELKLIRFMIDHLQIN